MVGYVFDWERCGRERFEAIVESLLVNKHETERTGRAQAVDGRGGDGGIDVDVTLDDGTLETIYQLKHFPEGLSGNYRDTRRRQIRGSYVTAMKQRPKRWVLVVPCNLTPKERSWLRSLAGKGGVVPTWMGVTDLEVEWHAPRTSIGTSRPTPSARRSRSPATSGHSCKLRRISTPR